ncbi:MAG: hypothetical protein L3J35_01295 [Bacteroidales bacterium]|nr:hypothetical protein [Bacteroidales bacterium]
MKTFKILSITAIIAMSVAIVSCDKNNQIKDLTIDIVGSYTGTVTSNNKAGVSDATADITRTDDNQIEIHCYGSEIDTTFIQRLFEDGDMIQMCTVGNDFYNEYGHDMTDQSEHHNMMKDSEGMSWAHHMDEEHENGDEHYGLYNSNSNVFTYTFKIMSGNTSYTAEFFGERN